MLSKITLLLCFVIPFSVWADNKGMNLSDFPETNRIWLGLEDGAIRPRNYDSIKVDSAKFIAIHAKDGQMLKKDEHWLTIDPEELQLERKALKLEEEKFKIKLREERWNGADVIEKQKLSLDGLKSKKQELQGFLERGENIGGLEGRIQHGLLDIDKKIQRIESQIDPENVKKEFELFESEGLLDLKRKRKRFELLERRSIVRAAFDGKLQLSELVNEEIAKLESEDDPAWILNNTTIATLVDEKHYEVVVKFTNSYTRGAKPENLMVLLQDSQTGQLIEGEFDRIEEIETGSGIKYNSIFKLNNLDAGVAKHSSGETHFVHVYRKYSEKHTLVQKKDIAFISPEILKQYGWSGLVKHLWPKSTVLQVGPQTILIKSSDEN